MKDKNINEIIFNNRKDFKKNILLEEDTEQNPFKQFEKWFEKVLKKKINEPSAMSLSTVDSKSQPHSRIVLLRGLTNQGFIFYTNYHSNKGKDLNEQPKASILFFWAELEQQIKINGLCKKVSVKESDDYFKLRPKNTQIGAWASKQSEIIKNREVLDKRIIYFLEKYKETPTIPRPPNWGGYILEPTYFEFWQGRENRLHDRIVYEKLQDKWNKYRLMP